MSMHQRISGRSTFVLYLIWVLLLGLAIALAVTFLVIVPDHQAKRAAEVQRAQGTATAEARQIEVERAYAAGVAFAAAGDWVKAAEEFGKAVVLEPAYKDAATLLAEARNKAEITKATATAQSAAAATAQALSEIEAAYQRGLAYINLKRWEQAKSEFDKVVDRDPNYREVESKLLEVEGKLNEDRALRPTASPTPSASPTPTRTATAEVKSPTLSWLGFSGDQVGKGDNNEPDGLSDGVFQLVLPDDGWTITHILLATPDGLEHWDSDGQESWVLGVLEGDSRQRLNKIGTLMDYRIKGIANLSLYAAVASTGFRPGERYITTVRFSDGYMLQLPIRIP